MRTFLPFCSILLVLLPLRSQAFQARMILTRGHGVRTAPPMTLGLAQDKDLPALHDVLTDDFSTQVYHASSLVKELYSSSSSTSKANSNDDKLRQLLQAQCSHSDGLRGFVAAYVTLPHDDATEDLPALLLEAFKGANLEELAPILCRNLILPASMVSVYKDPVLAANSFEVAQRTRRILSSLRGSINVVRHCQAVRTVVAATTTRIDDESDNKDKLQQFWSSVLEEYSFTPEQRQDIACAFTGVA